jgi:hypothetical protein
MTDRNPNKTPELRTLDRAEIASVSGGFCPLCAGPTLAFLLDAAFASAALRPII